MEYSNGARAGHNVHILTQHGPGRRRSPPLPKLDGTPACFAVAALPDLLLQSVAAAKPGFTEPVNRRGAARPR